jgi:hypothetical protein
MKPLEREVSKIVQDLGGGVWKTKVITEVLKKRDAKIKKLKREILELRREIQASRQ